MPRPTLYSFRRCPYAMRARLALFTQNINVVLREVVLRDKPSQMIEASPKATVPVLMLEGGKVIDESLDIMLWATDQNTTSKLYPDINTPTQEMLDLIAEMDGPFKHNLDRYKYANRYDGVEALPHREACLAMLGNLNKRLTTADFLFGDKQTFADIAIAPFIRQFANTDKDWFYATDYNSLQNWLSDFCDSNYFQSIMKKYPQWQAGDEITIFPPQQPTSNNT